jgi:alpha-beta hydrolase superfamily lysophospholipase
VSRLRLIAPNAFESALPLCSALLRNDFIRDTGSTASSSGVTAVQAWHGHAVHRRGDGLYVGAEDPCGFKRRITTAKQLGIMGGSNGGLLVSTVMTEHSELMGAVVCQMPLVDMLRYTKIGTGASGLRNMVIRPTAKWRRSLAPTSRIRT